MTALSKTKMLVGVAESQYELCNAIFLVMQVLLFSRNKLKIILSITLLLATDGAYN